MMAPIFQWLGADSAVSALLTSGSILKVFRDEAEQGTTAPYVRWALVAGQPENYVSDVPGIDNGRFQFDVIGRTRAEVDEVYEAVRTVLEQHGHIVFFAGSDKDPETKLFRLVFDMSVWTSR